MSTIVRSDDDGAAASVTETGVSGRYQSSLHDTRVAATLGIALGVSFTICFATGLLSHLIQYPPAWFGWPARPAGAYRVTQGLHVATGMATIPLLIAFLFFQKQLVEGIALSGLK